MLPSLKKVDIKIHITAMLHIMLFLLTNVRKVWVFLGISLGKVIGMEWQAEGLPPLPLWGRSSGCHSIPLTFPQEIPRKTHTFPPLVNKNIPFSLDFTMLAQIPLSIYYVFVIRDCYFPLSIVTDHGYR